jgi:8-oxo-dGTP diphosphatase
MESNSPQHIGVFVMVRNQANQVLLGERKNSYRAGLYGCPGGRLELTESLENGAKRELLEETGLKAISFNYVGVIRELQDGYNFIHFGFSCDNYQGVIELKEPDKCVGWKFYDMDHLPKLILPGHLAGIQLLKQAKMGDYVDILKA